MKECSRCGACAGDEALSCPEDGGELSERFTGPPLVDDTYRLIRRIGRGGSGDVYEAVHRHLGRTVALKLLRTDADVPERQARFAREARALGALGHPNVVGVSDSGVDERGLVYIVMERLTGRTLRAELASRGPIPIDEALRWLDGIARGLDAAHTAGILHRDLKPENVFLVDGSSGAAAVRVLDFGLVTRVGAEASELPTSSRNVDESDPTLTQEGMTLGTRAYLAPELATGGLASRQSDVYALGVVAFEMLAGQRPFLGSGNELLLRHVREEPPRPSSLEPSLSEEIDGALLASLSKEPEGRPASGAAFVLALTDAVERAGERVAVAPQGARRARTASPATLRRASLLAALLVGFLSAATWETGSITRLDGQLTSWRFALAPSRPADRRLLLVTLDDTSLTADPAPLGAQADLFAERLAALFDAGAAVVAVDLLLPESFSRSEAFSRLVLSHRDRLTLAAFSGAGEVVGPESLSGPTSVALGSSQASRLFGFVNLSGGVDDVVRDAPTSWVDRSGKRREAFAYHAARRLDRQLTDPERRVAVDYRVAIADVPRLSWRDVPEVAAREPERVRGRLVLVGGTFLGSGDDTYRNPTLPAGSRIPGVVLQAIVANTFLTGAPLRTLPIAWGIAGVTLGSGLLVTRLLRARPLPTLLVSAGLPPLLFAASIGAGFVLPVGGIAVSLGMAALLGLGLRKVLVPDGRRGR